MKTFYVIVLSSLLSVLSASADDRPISFEQLPSRARTFIKTHFPSGELLYATVDDDFIRPDYEVMLTGDVRIQFENDGQLEKVEAKAGVPDGIVPDKIKEYISRHYPGAAVVEFEIDRKEYEVKLSNRLEIKFNKNYNVIDID